VRLPAGCGIGRVSAFEPPLSETPSTKPQLQRSSKSQETKPQKQMPGQTAAGF